MKILLIDPDPQIGHIAFSRAFIEATQRFATVELLTTEDYATKLAIDCATRPPLPVPPPTGKIRTRLWNLKIARQTLREARGKHDAIIYLGFDLPTFTLYSHLLPRRKPIWAILHHQIDFRGSRIKRIFFNNVAHHVHYLVLSNYIAQADVFTRNKRAWPIPHPYYSALQDACSSRATDAHQKAPTGKGKLIFAPSRSNQEEFMERLAELLEAGDRVLCRNPPRMQSDHFEKADNFQNYYELMAEADVVFVGARFGLRVSGVAFEALYAGKPLIMPTSGFALELKEQYPSAVHLLEYVNNLRDVEMPRRHEINRFRKNHCPNAVANALQQIIEQRNT